MRVGCCCDSCCNVTHSQQRQHNNNRSHRRRILDHRRATTTNAYSSIIRYNSRWSLVVTYHVGWLFRCVLLLLFLVVRPHCIQHAVVPVVSARSVTTSLSSSFPQKQQQYHHCCFQSQRKASSTVTTTTTSASALQRQGRSLSVFGGKTLQRQQQRPLFPTMTGLCGKSNNEDAAAAAAGADPTIEASVNGDSPAAVLDEFYPVRSRQQRKRNDDVMTAKRIIKNPAVRSTGAASAATVLVCVVSILLAQLNMVLPPAIAVDDYTTTTTTSITPTTVVAATSSAPPATKEPTTTTTLTESSSSIMTSASNQHRHGRYWDVMTPQQQDDATPTKTMEEQQQQRIQANIALMEYVVGTVKMMYYDATGGISFDARDFDTTWRRWLQQQQQDTSTAARSTTVQRHPSSSSTHSVLSTRDGVVQSLKSLIQNGLNDPYSMYLTREELRAELQVGNTRNEGFLGLGVFVEPPSPKVETFLYGPAQQPVTTTTIPTTATTIPSSPSLLHLVTTLLPVPAKVKAAESNCIFGVSDTILMQRDVQSLPVVVAVIPNSPAERAGLIVGDRIVAIGVDSFAGLDVKAVTHKLTSRYRAENYMGHPILTVAKPVYATYTYPLTTTSTVDTSSSEVVDIVATADSPSSFHSRDVLRGYRPIRVRLSTLAADEPPAPSTMNWMEDENDDRSLSGNRRLVGGDAIVHYEMLTPQTSIFDLRNNNYGTSSDNGGDVGYIRLTRFSRASTQGFIRAVEALEAAGASSYIIDLRNNYGGVIQEAMLTASMLLRDPHAVICYTMNSHGAFTPHYVEDYVVDNRYPGYLLSQEPRTATLNQVKKENPDFFEPNGWLPINSYVDLPEQRIKRGQHAPGSIVNAANSPTSNMITRLNQLTAQKNLVVLINEGTASSAEVFAAALHDNGRTVALVGSKTYGKGLVQHTFPLPDGGGLRLTVAEYLTPALRHVTVVGNAQYDRQTGEWVGGGIRPDIVCDHRQGIQSNIGADLCVGMALDALEEATMSESETL